MSPYLKKLKGVTELVTSVGASAGIDNQFFILSGRIVSDYVYAQSQIQKIVYCAFGQEVHRAGHSLKKITSPRARLDFLESYNNISANPDILVVYRFAKKILVDIYELRNSLVHDIWKSSVQFPGKLLLSSLDEDSRLLFASEKLSHLESANILETHQAILRFIDRIHILGLEDIYRAKRDIDTCNLCLMQIGFALEQKSETELQKIIDIFLAFEGISHLFPEERRIKGSLEWQYKSGRVINV